MMRVAIVVPNAFDLWNFRRPLITALRDCGVAVAAIAPPDPRIDRVEAMGCTYIPWQLRRRSYHPGTEASSLLELYRIFKDWRPTIVQLFTVKPNLYGTVAARAAGVPIVVTTVTGLGYVWVETSLKIRILRYFLAGLYRQAIRQADAVIYLNEEDHRALGDGRVTLIIPGEGVDLSQFHPSVLPRERLRESRRKFKLPEDAPVVLMLARMLRHKGVAEFADAAARVRRRWPEAVFLLVGPLDDGNPACIPGSEIHTWEAQGAVRYLGMQEDVVELIALADIVALPSYREGMPRTLIEGAAMGKPLVATDVPGCRDVIHHGLNGLKVPPRDPAALAEAIEALLLAPLTRASFAWNSRVVAEAQYDSHRIAQQILALYGRLLTAKGLGIPPGFLGPLTTAPLPTGRLALDSSLGWTAEHSRA